jgi:hypothetical protein
LTSGFPQDKTFRVLYVLNTDGEANDGKIAASNFVSGYEALRMRFPNMVEARTFVLGIGANHDQKVPTFSIGTISTHRYIGSRGDVSGRSVLL